MKLITKLVPHPGGHIDEAFAGVLARVYGREDKIVVARTARFEPRTLTGNEEVWIAKGELPLGQCRGMFDDKDLVTGEHVENTCTALNMAKYLEVQNRPELSKLLQAVCRDDNSGKNSPSSISTLMKGAIGSTPIFAHDKIFAWAEEGIMAQIGYMIETEKARAENRKIVCTDYVRPTAVLDSMVANEAIVDKHIEARMRKMLLSSEAKVEDCMELSFIARAMKVIGKSDKDTAAWQETALAKYAEQQLKYRDALHDIGILGRHFPIMPRFEGENMFVLVMDSDNDQIANASRDPRYKYAVSIVRKKTGNVAVIPNYHDELDMRAVWALIRMEETPFEKRKDADFADYCRAGNHPAAPHWHMMKGGLALNGSNFIEAQPTKLSNKSLVNIVSIGFVKEARERFEALKAQSAKCVNPVKATRTNTEAAAPIIQSKVGLDKRSLIDLGKVFDSSFSA